MQRRKFLKLLGGTAGVGMFGGLYSWQIEPFWLEFVEITMPLRHLPPHWHGKTLMHLSDLHVSNRFDYQYLIESLQKAKAYNPDLVVYTGDFLTNGYTHVKSKIEAVLDHAVLGKEGTFAVLGNHDYGRNWAETEVAESLVKLLEDRSIVTLRNERVNLDGLQIFGFDDLWGPNFDVETTLKEFHAKKAAIALCHNPDACDQPGWESFEGWILSGHTHGGQVRAPFLDPWVLPVENDRYTAGRIELDSKRTLYINRALGHLHQIRFNVRPEITLFTLEGRSE